MWGTPWQKHNFVDAGHIQGIPVFRQSSLFSGQWYPDAKYDPITDTINNYGAVAKKYYKYSGLLRWKDALMVGFVIVSIIVT
jgi:hypothetical protein